MARPTLAPELVEQIQSAPIRESPESIAARLGVAVGSVKKYRRAGREQRQEAAREIVARHVEENVPDALADLTEIRRLAREVYERTQDPRQGNLWLSAVKTTLEHVSPDAAALDAAIDAELAALHEEGQGGVSRPGTGQAAGSAGVPTAVN